MLYENNGVVAPEYQAIIEIHSNSVTERATSKGVAFNSADDSPGAAIWGGLQILEVFPGGELAGL